jgi:hypothetical protein
VSQCESPQHTVQERRIPALWQLSLEMDHAVTGQAERSCFESLRDDEVKQSDWCTLKRVRVS